jgi:hypothetical protein
LALKRQICGAMGYYTAHPCRCYSTILPNTANVLRESTRIHDVITERPQTKMTIITDDSYLQVSPEVSHHSSLQAFANWTVSYINNAVFEYTTQRAEEPLRRSSQGFLLYECWLWKWSRDVTYQDLNSGMLLKNALRKGIFYCKY